MDYKHYIDSDISNDKIYSLRDSVLYRLYSARFHFQLLLEYHHRVEHKLEKIHKDIGSKLFFKQSYEVTMIQEQSIKEIYSLFDSMMYHLCSIYDYLFRLINFAHGTTILKNPKWNRFQDEKNKKGFIYCSQEMASKLEKIDKEFVYPLLGHRSHLIHTEYDTGEFTLELKPNGESFDAKFFATNLFKENFPEIKDGDKHLTIKYSALWLIDKTIKTTTEILFELREDMIRNKKQPHGFFATIGENGTFESVSIGYWGDRNKC